MIHYKAFYADPESEPMDPLIKSILWGCPKRARYCRNGIYFVIPDPDPGSPVYINDWGSRIRCGMTPFLDSLMVLVFTWKVSTVSFIITQCWFYRRLSGKIQT